MSNITKINEYNITAEVQEGKQIEGGEKAQWTRITLEVRVEHGADAGDVNDGVSVEGPMHGEEQVVGVSIAHEGTEQHIRRVERRVPAVDVDGTGSEDGEVGDGVGGGRAGDRVVEGGHGIGGGTEVVGSQGREGAESAVGQGRNKRGEESFVGEDDGWRDSILAKGSRGRDDDGGMLEDGDDSVGVEDIGHDLGEGDGGGEGNAIERTGASGTRVYVVDT